MKAFYVAIIEYDTAFYDLFPPSQWSFTDLMREQVQTQEMTLIEHTYTEEELLK
jgi:hypothetical protein